MRQIDRLLCMSLVMALVGCDSDPKSETSSSPTPVAVEEEETPLEEPLAETDEVEAAIVEESVTPELEVEEDASPSEPCEETLAQEDAAVLAETVPSLDLNLFNPDDNLTAFTKMRGSLDPQEEVVFYWKGNIFAVQDADPYGAPISEYPSPILKFEGFNIARFVPTWDGVRMISREMSVYRNNFGAIVDCWDNGVLNPEEAKLVPVVHVWNDPVNFTVTGGNPQEMGEQVVWTMEVMLRYPSALPVDDYPEYSAGNTYESSEMFNFYSKKEDLNNPELDSVPVTISWSRVGQFLPWMQMGQTQGKLLYHTYGQKLMGGIDDLPPTLRAYVEKNAPEFLEAPSVDTSPNDTSWRVFKKLMDSGEYSPVCE